MDEQTGDMMDFKALLLDALPPGTATNVSSVEDLKERVARKKRRRRSAAGTLGVLACVVPLLILVLIPFVRSDHSQAVHTGGRPVGMTPGSLKTGLTRIALPGPYTGYVASGALAISPNGKTAYVGDAQIGLVTPIDLPSGRAQRPITLGNWGINAIAITPSGRTAYVVEGGIADAIIPIDLATRTVGPAIHVPGVQALGSAIAITPDGHMAYVDSLGEQDFRYTTPATVATTTTHTIPSYVVPIDLRTNTAMRPISLDPLSTGGHIVRSEEPTCDTNCAFEETIGGIEITPDGRTAYVSQDGEVPPSGVFAISLTTEQVGPNISIPEGAAADPLAITPDGRTVYVAGGGTVTPIDLASDSVGSSIHVVPAGELVAGMAITPNGGTLVVDGDPDLATINLQNGMVKTLLEDQAGGDIAIVPTSKVSSRDGS
jgi:DNA-binding beta-propeller fold protein YncE